MSIPGIYTKTQVHVLCSNNNIEYFGESNVQIPKKPGWGLLVFVTCRLQKNGHSASFDCARHASLGITRHRKSIFDGLPRANVVSRMVREDGFEPSTSAL